MIYRRSVRKLLSVTGQDMGYKHYNIGQLARAAGVPVSTLRYYERVGLLAPAGRAHNNYRFYTQDTRDAMGPQVGTYPPDFCLKRLGTADRVRLSSFRGQRP